MLAAACAALADWLFYGREVGISLALFLGVLGVVAIAANRVRATPKTRIVMTAVFIAGLLPLVEDVSLLSAIVGTLATAMFVIVMTASEATSWQRNLFEAATIPFRGPFQLIGDTFAALQRMTSEMPEWLRARSLIAWIIPLAAFALQCGALPGSRRGRPKSRSEISAFAGSAGAADPRTRSAAGPGAAARCRGIPLQYGP